jgi:hypothetical protein
VGIIGRHINIQPEEDNMTEPTIPMSTSLLAIELYQPEPDVFYSLDTAVHLAGVSRRSFLVYCRAGLVRPVFQPPYGVMEFTEDAIYTVRRMEHLRAVHRSDLAWLNTVLTLLNEVERLRAELRFFRND